MGSMGRRGFRSEGRTIHVLSNARSPALRSRPDIPTFMSADPGSRFDFERVIRGRGIGIIAGVDEAGRGPLAGPVVAAAVVLPADWIDSGLPVALRGLNDSKQVSPRRREDFYGILMHLPASQRAVAVVEAGEIDRMNILRATHQAMVRALTALQPGPEHVLVDGLEVSAIPWPQTALVKGDSRSYSIAAASILAKVTRDRLMVDHDRRWPGYGFAIHKGYPTPGHLRVLARLGPCPIHRRSFAPVAAAMPDLFGG